MRGWLMCVVGFFVFSSSGPVWAGDRLNAARGAARSSSSSSSSSTTTTTSDGSGLAGVLSLLADDDDCWCDDDDAVSLGLWQPSAPTIDERRGFLPYPYADGEEGFMVREAPDGTMYEDAREASFRIGAEGAYLYDDVWRGSANVRILLPRFYVEGRYDHYLEGPTAVLDGDLEVSGTVRDRLHVATMGFGLQLSPGERLAVRMGPTFAAMISDERSLAADTEVLPGVGAAAEIDVYPVRPLVFSGRAAMTRFPGAFLFEARATAGVSLHRVELFAGYDHRVIDGINLGGPMLGVNLRF
ncbi:MAG: hypothetical protein AAGA54_23080 [Myxococcota bacterium]